MVSKVLSWNKRFSKLAYGRKQSIKLRARTPLPGIGCVPQVFPREHGKRWRLIWRGVMGHLAPALSLNLLCVIHPSWGKSPTETATSPSLCTCLSLGQDQFTGLFSSLSHATASFWDTSLSWFPPGSQLDRISAHLAQELKNHLLQPKCLTHIQILSGHLAKSFQRMVNFRIQEGSVVTFSDPRALKKKSTVLPFSSQALCSGACNAHTIGTPVQVPAALPHIQHCYGTWEYRRRWSCACAPATVEDTRVEFQALGFVLVQPPVFGEVNLWIDWLIGCFNH